MKPIRVVLADDHHVVRAAVAFFLSQLEDIDIVGEVAEGAKLIDAIKRLMPDVLVLDAHMPGHKVMASARILHNQYPKVRVLILTGYDRREYLEGLLGEGALGYVLKDDEPHMLAEAIRSVSQGEEYVTKRASAVLVRSVRTQSNIEQANLSRREMDVLRLMAKGKMNAQIAEILHLSQQTVKNYVSYTFKKIGVKSRIDAVLWAFHNDVVRHDDDDGDIDDLLL